MCKMFEVVTGRKSKGSVDKLEGLTKAYTDIHEDIAIIRIPVELLEIDSDRRKNGKRFKISH